MTVTVTIVMMMQCLNRPLSTGHADANARELSSWYDSKLDKFAWQRRNLQGTS